MADSALLKLGPSSQLEARKKADATAQVSGGSGIPAAEAQARRPGLACPAPDTLNKFVFLELEGEWLGWGYLGHQ